MSRRRKPGAFRKGKVWAIDVRDSANTRHRPTFATREEAQRAYDSITAQKAAGEYFATAATATFSDALDLLVNRKVSGKNRKLTPNTHNRIKSIVENHLRPDLGYRKLSEFPAARMQFVKDWLDAKSSSLASSSLAHLHSAMKLALDCAINEQWLGAPNPMGLFKVRVPVGQEMGARRPLTLDEIGSVVRGGMIRTKHERELTFATRFMIVMLGLLAGLRDQECSGLCWDHVELDGRMIFVRKVYRKGVGLITGTKTGESGFRDIPMSPLLHAALIAYRERLLAMGMPAGGSVPVLVTERVGVIRPDAIMINHWRAIAGKAGFTAPEGHVHTYYALRHTAACMWRTIGMDLEHLRELMGHTSFETTSKRYLHRTPTFDVLRREVEALGLERTPQGLIDGLGIVLARRWRDDGIEMSCSPPAAMLPRLEYGGEDQRLLAAPHAGNGQVINGQAFDVEPDAITATPPIRSLRELREWQRSEARRLAELGWKHSRIADRLEVDPTTVSNMVRTSDEQIWPRKLSHAARADLRERARKQ